MEYLLDTNCIRRVKGDLLERGRASGLRFAVSPMSIWELLSHFDTGDADFPMCRGWLRKLRHCAVLDHPVAELLDAVGVTPYVPRHARHPWFEREAAMVAIEIFGRALTPDEVHRATFHDAEGHLRTLRDCGQSAKQELARLEAQHATEFTDVLEGFRTAFARQGRDPHEADGLTDREFVNHVVGETERITRTADSPTIEDAAHRILECSFVRTGYVIESALRHLRTRARVDPNDYEDELLCAHLDLRTPRVLVTEDKRMHEILTRVGARLARTAVPLGLEARPGALVVHRRDFEASLRAT